ncbi:unnamed protein product [Candidula unifasciata]|uniref:Mitochondrial ribosomal protein L27 n=1 Tax=Candidula unifasciata TaxID=100452 RepID=A0A8S3ZPR7_9EUPU|nr:unnamed protein product [Candidula unifasciata]
MALSLVRTLSSTLSPFLSAAAASRALPAMDMTVRNASKKSGGSTRNTVGRPRRKNRGIKVQDGAFVHKGDLLVKQYGLKFYPGEHVYMDDQWSLRAAHDGIVVLTTEQLNPYPDSPLYQHIQNGFVMNKHFFSVIPTPLHGKFKLVSET